MLAAYRGGELVYVGNVGTGFTEQEIERLLKVLKPLQRDKAPFRELPKMPRVRKGDVVWVEPKLVAEVEFVEWTHDGRLRAPAYKGLRDDKDARDVRIEEPMATEIRKGKRVLKLSNLDKPFWPEEGITKGDLLSYYQSVADALVPHLKNRPFTMKRYPDGWQGEFFFQKDAPKHMPDWIETREIDVSTRESPRRTKRIRAPLVNDELALLWMVNMGCIDMNTWYSRVDKPERPDWVLFDLDPSPDVGFKETVQVALLVKQALDALQLDSFVKTSGADGIHVLVPIARRYTYADTRRFSAIIAGALARSYHGPRHDGVDEGETARRPDRLEPERRGEDDCVGLLGAAEGGRARLDAVALGRGDRGSRPGRLHDGRRARPRAEARRPLRGRADDEAVADDGAEGALARRRSTRASARGRARAPSASTHFGSNDEPLSSRRSATARSCVHASR